jgi:hypothetical protein
MNLQVIFSTNARGKINDIAHLQTHKWFFLFTKYNDISHLLSHKISL